MRQKLSLAMRILLGCLLAWGTATATAQNLLYVGNSRGDDVSIVDLANLKVVGSIKLGDRIHGVTVQPDGKRLFVDRNGIAYCTDYNAGLYIMEYTG